MVREPGCNKGELFELNIDKELIEEITTLTWLVLGGDPAARSHRVEHCSAPWTCNALEASDGVSHRRISHEGGQLASYCQQ